MTVHDVTAEDVARTGRDTTIAQWGVASVVMAGSAVAGGFSFHYLGEFPALGVITALAVDLALAAWLVISRRLRAADVTCVAGWALELTTAAMTLYLNVGAALFRGIDPSAARWLLAVAHTFLPVVLVLVTTAGTEAQAKLTRLSRLKAEAERVESDMRRVALQAEIDAARLKTEAEERQRAEGELVTAADLLGKATELRHQAERERASTEVERDATRVTDEASPVEPPSASVTRLRQVPRPGDTSTAQERQAWIEERLNAGQDVTGPDVKIQFPDASNAARDVAKAKSRRDAAPRAGLKSMRRSES